MMRRYGVWIIAVAFIATRATAQQPVQHFQGSLTIAGGSATDVVGATSHAVSVLPAMAFTPDPRIAFGVGGNATQYNDARWSLGGLASAAGRLPVGSHAALTLNADGGATTTSYDFSYTTVTALPAVEAVAGPVTAYLGANVAAATSRLTRITSPAAGLFGDLFSGSTPSDSSISASRTSHGVVAGANLHLSVPSGESIVVGLRQQHGMVDTISTRDRSASASLSAGRFTLNGTMGVRTEPGVSTRFGSGALSLAIDSRISIAAAAGAYPADHLIGTPRGRFATLGLSLSTGRAEQRAASAAGVSAPAAGFTRLAIRSESARRVEVAGDFSNWKLITATRAPNGVWYADIRIPPGQYRYAFRIDGTTWAVPDGSATAEDGFGGKSAWLTVSDTPNRSAR